MFCSKCGNKLDEDAVFCSACGNKVASNQNVNTQQQTDNATQQSVYTQQANQQTNQSYSYGQGVPYGNQQTVNYQTYQVSYGNSPLEELRKKLQIDMIIWIVVASIQAILAVYFFITGMTLSSYYLGDFAGNYYINGIALAIVSVLNFVSSYKTSNMRTRIATVPTGIVGEYEALAPYVVNLVYNAIFGGLIGIVGSIYGFVIRSYVMKNKFYFVKIEENYRKNPHANFWRCSNCGRVNLSFEEICICGVKKDDAGNTQ